MDSSDDDPLDDGDGTDHDVLPGTSSTIPVRLHDDDDDGDGDGGGSGDGGGDGDGDGGDGGGGDDDDDDDGSGGHPPGFSSDGHDYFPTAGSSTPIYDQYSYGGGGGSDASSGASSSRRDKGKNIGEGERQCDIGQIGGDMSLLYLHNNDYGYVHYPLPMPSQDSSSISSSRHSMDYGHRYGDYGQSDMASQLATSFFGENYGQYQQPEQRENNSYNQDPPRKSFWW